MPAGKGGTADFLVRARGDAWEVLGTGRVSTHATREEAISAAQVLIGTKGGELRIEGRRGRTRSSLTIGRDPFARISAVEGMAPTREAESRARDFDRRELTQAERREAIIEAYRSKP